MIYTNPEVAGVGETEQSAKEKGLDDDQEGPDAVAAVTWRKMKAETVLSRSLWITSGIKLLGVHMITNYSSEIIWGADALVDKEMNIESIKRSCSRIRRSPKLSVKPYGSFERRGLFPLSCCFMNENVK